MGSMNETPSGERIRIGIFGRTNAGKSSLVNAITGQSLSLVSPVHGTTTDPVSKAMELLPLGPVLLTDTPGLDDTGDLGMLRIEAARRILRETDIAILAIDGTKGSTDFDETIHKLILEAGIPCLTVYTRKDLPGSMNAVPEAGSDGNTSAAAFANGETPDTESAGDVLHVSSVTGEGIDALKEKLASMNPDTESSLPIVSDLVRPGDYVTLVVPIDKAAPKGRLILPQQQTIRELLDAGCVPIVCRDSELAQVFDQFGQNIALVITDSQAFETVAHILPPETPLTSFSILMARHKGNLIPAVCGINALKSLGKHANVLICEGCTHHRQCGDIGTQKLPAALLKKYPGTKFEFTFTSGREYPDDLSGYDLIIHCGGCMLSEREMKRRYRQAEGSLRPVTNYGIVLSHLNGILDRCTAMLPEITSRRV